MMHVALAIVLVILVGFFIFAIVKYSGSNEEAESGGEKSEAGVIDSDSLRDKDVYDDTGDTVCDSTGFSDIYETDSKDSGEESVSGAENSEESTSGTDKEDDLIETVGRLIFGAALVFVGLAMPYRSGFHPLNNWFRSTFIEKDSSSVNNKKNSEETQKYQEEKPIVKNVNLVDDLWTEYFNSDDTGADADYTWDNLDFEKQVCSVAEDQFGQEVESQTDRYGQWGFERLFFYSSADELRGYALPDAFYNYYYYDTDNPRGFVIFDSEDNLKGYWFVYPDKENRCTYWKQWDAERDTNIRWWVNIEQYEGGHVKEFMFYEAD